LSGAIVVEGNGGEFEAEADEARDLAHAGSKRGLGRFANRIKQRQKLNCETRALTPPFRRNLGSFD